MSSSDVVPVITTISNGTWVQSVALFNSDCITVRVNATEPVHVLVITAAGFISLASAITRYHYYFDIAVGLTLIDLLNMRGSLTLPAICLLLLIMCISSATCALITHVQVVQMPAGPGCRTCSPSWTHSATQRSPSRLTACEYGLRFDDLHENCVSLGRGDSINQYVQAPAVPDGGVYYNKTSVSFTVAVPLEGAYVLGVLNPSTILDIGCNYTIAASSQDAAGGCSTLAHSAALLDTSWRMAVVWRMRGSSKQVLSQGDVIQLRLPTSNSLIMAVQNVEQ